MLCRNMVVAMLGIPLRLRRGKTRILAIQLQCMWHAAAGAQRSGLRKLSVNRRQVWLTEVSILLGELWILLVEGKHLSSVPGTEGHWKEIWSNFLSVRIPLWVPDRKKNNTNLMDSSSSSGEGAFELLLRFRICHHLQSLTIEDDHFHGSSKRLWMKYK